MNTVKILNTTISEISLSEVSNILNSENSLKVAICNTILSLGAIGTMN